MLPSGAVWYDGANVILGIIWLKSFTSLAAFSLQSFELELSCLDCSGGRVVGWIHKRAFGGIRNVILYYISSWIHYSWHDLLMQHETSHSICDLTACTTCLRLLACLLSVLLDGEDCCVLWVDLLVLKGIQTSLHCKHTSIKFCEYLLNNVCGSEQFSLNHNIRFYGRLVTVIWGRNASSCLPGSNNSAFVVIWLVHVWACTYWISILLCKHHLTISWVGIDNIRCGLHHTTIYSLRTNDQLCITCTKRDQSSTVIRFSYSSSMPILHESQYIIENGMYS